LHPEANASALPDAPGRPGVPVRVEAIHQEKNGPVYTLTGKARIDYRGYTIFADRARFNEDTGEGEGEGNLLLEGGPNDEHIEASKGTYNLNEETGKFHDAHGSVGFRLRSRRNILTTTNPFFFSGRIVDKLGPDHYRVSDGTVTTCEMPRPKWEFAAHQVNVEVGGRATIYHSNFRIASMPVFYFPYATHPVQKTPRQTGFLIPSIGRSSIRGNTVGESVFWAINRSMDLLAGAEYYSKRGWAPDGEFRAQPSDNSYLDLTFFSVLDRGLNGVHQGGTEVRLNADGDLAHNLRGVASADYLSSYVFRLAFSDVFAQAVNSEVRSQAFLSHASGSFFLNAQTSRYQDFQSTRAGDVITILHAPGFEASSVEQRLGSTPFEVSFDADAEGLSRSEPGFSTLPVLVGRFDLAPAISMRFGFAGWSFRPELSLRDTVYSQQLNPAATTVLTDVGTVSSNILNRRSIGGSLEIRPPVLERVFGGERFGRKWKHVVEPRVVYARVAGVDNFSHILRFDDRDILSDTDEFEYAIVNRLYARRTSSGAEKCPPPGMPALIVGAAPDPPPSRIPWERERNPQPVCRKPQPDTREILTWELAQKYFIDPTFGGALTSGRTNIFTSTVDLTGIAFLTEPRHLSPLVSRLRFGTTANSDLEWDADYDFFAGRVNSSTVLFNYRFGLFTVGAGDAFLHVPGEITNTAVAPAAPKFNQFRVVLGYGNANKRGFSGATNLGFDAQLGQVQYGSVQLGYNWDCCGVSLEYRRFSLATVRNENQYRFTFSLANVGAFGNLRRTERLF